MLDQIKGHLVWMPLDFLRDVQMAEVGLQVNSWVCREISLVLICEEFMLTVKNTNRRRAFTRKQRIRE